MRMQPRVLLVEDDARLAELVASFLRKHGMDLRVAPTLAEARTAIAKHTPSIILLDIGLPDGDGLTFCREIRDDFRGGIIILTARGEELDELSGFDSGADDYVAKPVRPQLLLARVNALMRRSGAGRALRVGDLVMDLDRRVVSANGDQVALTDAEFELLRVLMAEPGKPFTRDQLFETLRGIGYDGVDRSIDQRISKLRRKLGDDPRSPRHIRSVRGVGYMLMGSQT